MPPRLEALTDADTPLPVPSGESCDGPRRLQSRCGDRSWVISDDRVAEIEADDQTARCGPMTPPTSSATSRLWAHALLGKMGPGRPTPNGSFEKYRSPGLTLTNPPSRRERAPTFAPRNALDLVSTHATARMESQLAVKINESDEMPHRTGAETDHRHTVVVVGAADPFESCVSEDHAGLQALRACRRRQQQ